MESAKNAFAATKGYWGKIFGNIILLQVCFFVVLMGLQIVLSVLAAMAGDSAGMLQSLVQQVLGQVFGIAFAVFLVQLSGTIIANPKTA